jgi:hypothetical protein
MAASLTMAALTHPLGAEPESAAEFFYKDKLYWSKGVSAPSTLAWAGGLSPVSSRSPDKETVAKMVAYAAREKLGHDRVADTLRLTRLESGFRCNVLGPKTRHGRAVGPLQVLPKSAEALGISTQDLHSDCRAQIEAGLRHMEKCISVGARTYNQLAACHVAGWQGWNKRLSRQAERYKQKYVKMAAGTQVPAWAGKLHTW